MKMRMSSRVNFRNNIFSLLAVLLALALCSLPSFAQSANGTIQGAVTDNSGAAVPNATVKVRNTATGIERVTQTDGDGNYSVPALPAGPYNIEIQAAGMQKQVIQKIDLDVSRTLAVNAKLKVGGTSEVVTVTGETPAIEASTITVGTVIDSKTVQDIPLNGRHFVDLAIWCRERLFLPQMVFSLRLCADREPL